MMKIISLIFLFIFLSTDKAIAGEETYKRTRSLMGTEMEITVVSADEKKAYTAIDAAFAEISRIEQLMSTYIPESQISRINSAAGKKAVKVDAELLRLIKRAIEYAEMTEGGFNIAVGPLIKLWKVAEGGNIPGSEEIKRAKEIVNYKDIIIDEKQGAIFLIKNGMSIDLGGIAKGYASDMAKEALEKKGIKAGIIAVAGDINAFGKKPDTLSGGKAGRWRIGIRHPRKKDAFIGIIELEDEAVSTSGDYERFFIKDGKRYHHIIDPKTGEPADKCQSVTIVAKEAVATDALSTGIFVMGPKKGIYLVERLKGIEAVIVDAKGNVEFSSGLKGRIEIPKAE
ncbi:MAG: FAD:protein FMN transferase [Nitrospirae bacterium]|nr:FAD:protein FMN transferase [Nitrospirota bacterium]